VEYRRLGDSDLHVSEISLGSWLTYGGGVERAQAEYEERSRPESTSPRKVSAWPRAYTFAVSMKLMPTSNAFSTHA
jgi:hypothetical protein